MPVAFDDSEATHTHAGADIVSGTVTDSRLSSKVALDDSTHTFTNKTMDADGTGNVLTNVGDAEIQSHTTTKITANLDTLITGTLADANIEDMAATKLTGTINIARVPDTAKKISLIVALGDETTVLTAATSVVTFRMPFAFTLDEVRGTLSTAGTGAALVTVDIHESGTTIMTTDKITIDATEKTSETAATAPAITDSALADDAEMTIDIDTIDTDNVAAGLKVYLIGQRA